MAITEQQKQKKAKQKKQKRTTQPKSNSSQLLEKIKPCIENPIYECLIPNNLFSSGIGNVLITRLSSNGEIAIGSFIVDVYCLGIKQILFKTMPITEYESAFKPNIIKSHGDHPFTTIKPSCAYKLLEGAAQYATALGFAPHKDYAALKTIFGKDHLKRCWSRYRYGKDKLPYYVKGPNESSTDANKIVATLQKSCGPGNFHFHL